MPKVSGFRFSKSMCILKVIETKKSKSEKFRNKETIRICFF